MYLAGARQNKAALTYNASPLNIAAKMNPEPIDYEGQRCISSSRLALLAVGLTTWRLRQWAHTEYLRSYSHQNSGPSGPRRANLSRIRMSPTSSPLILIFTYFATERIAGSIEATNSIAMPILNTAMRLPLARKFRNPCPDTAQRQMEGMFTTANIDIRSTKLESGASGAIYETVTINATVQAFGLTSCRLAAWTKVNGFSILSVVSEPKPRLLAIFHANQKIYNAHAMRSPIPIAG